MSARSARRLSARCLAAALVAGVLGSVACTSTAKRETATLAEAVDRYRRASGLAKDGDGQAVAALSCTDARVCAAKQSCVAAIDPTTRALALKDEVALRLADIEQKRLAPDSTEAQALPGKLDEAERLLKEGRARMAECDAKLAELQATVGR
jgi:hypothetical protein